jgi:predicted DNA-binding transcriptional regulator AlpA
MPKRMSDPFCLTTGSGGSIQKVIFTRTHLKQLGINSSKTTLLRWERLGRSPQRLRFAGATVCWLSSELYAWLEERSRERASHVYAEY